MSHARITAALGVVLLLSVGACVGTSDPTPMVASVSLELNRTSLRTGDTLVLRVIGTNTSSETIEVPNAPCLAAVDVRNDQGQAVQFGDPIYCSLPLYPPKVLAPGDTWGDTVRLTHPPVGEFRIRAGLPLEIGRRYVYSNEASVTVLP